MCTRGNLFDINTVCGLTQIDHSIASYVREKRAENVLYHRGHVRFELCLYVTCVVVFIFILKTINLTRRVRDILYTAV